MYWFNHPITKSLNSEQFPVISLFWGIAFAKSRYSCGFSPNYQKIPCYFPCYWGIGFLHLFRSWIHKQVTRRVLANYGSHCPLVRIDEQKRRKCDTLHLIAVSAATNVLAGHLRGWAPHEARCLHTLIIPLVCCRPVFAAAGFVATQARVGRAGRTHCRRLTVTRGSR